MALASMAYVCSCHAEVPKDDANTIIAKMRIPRLPEGPFSGWSDQQKTDAIKRISGFCQFLCVDTHTESFPNEAAANRAKAEVLVCVGACIANHLPPDYPQLPALREQLRANYEKARALGSAIPWPLPQK